MTNHVKYMMRPPQPPLPTGDTIADLSSLFKYTEEVDRWLQHISENQNLAGEWQYPTLTNSWVENGGGYAQPAYRTLPGRCVQVVGTIKNGTLNAAAFTFPDELCPASARAIATAPTSGNEHRVIVLTNGQFRPNIGDNTFFDIACIFSLEIET